METILKQKVFHDGTSMKVLKPGDQFEVPADKVEAWREEGVIVCPDAPERPALPAAPLGHVEGELLSIDDSAFIDRIAEAVVAKLMVVGRMPAGGALDDVEDEQADDDDDAMPEAREPRFGDEVTHEEKGGGWHCITAPWLAEPIKLQGDDAAAAKVAELRALVPTAEAPPAAPPA